MKCLDNCHGIVTVSEPLAEVLAARHKKDVHVVYNGFDSADYPKNIELTKKFTITYTGSIYPGRRDPTPLFEAISNLSKRRAISLADIGIRLYGYGQSAIKSLAEKYNIEDYVTCGGTIAYDDSLAKQCESWLLLLLEHNDLSAKGIVTGKMFEYLGARRPILFIGYEEGVASDILRQTGSGVVLNNTSNIETFLMKCLDSYAKGDRSLGFALNRSAEKYSRRYGAESLSKILLNYV